jgi:N-acetylneuraminate synthase
VDSAFSLEPEELRLLVVETGRAWQALGGVSYGTGVQEAKSLIFRRSLYVVRDIAPGGFFTADTVRAIRPGMGLPPKYLEAILGMSARRHIKRGTPLSWDLVK